MRNQINLVRKGLEPGNVCLTDSLLSKQTRMPVCVWSLVPGTLGCRGLCSPSQAVCRAGGGGAAHTGWAPGRGGGLDTPGTCFLLPGTSNRLMRQSQQERRIAVQLMHVRHEKEVLWQNRIFREKQYEERRLKDFQDALDREAVNNTSLSNPSKVSFDPFYRVKVNRSPFRCQSFHESVFLYDLSIICLFLLLYSYTNSAHPHTMLSPFSLDSSNISHSPPVLVSTSL